MKSQIDRNTIIAELVKSIQQKLKKIESSLEGTDPQVLLMVNDELDDVLLNWSHEMTSAIQFKNPAVDDEDDEDEDSW